MKRLLFLFTLLVWSWSAVGQITVSGKTTDEKTGEPLVGVNIYVAEESQGTVSDANGFYELTLASDAPVTIVFSYVGYLAREMVVNRSRELNVALYPSVRLEEVIIQSVRADENIPITQTVLSKREIRSVYNGEDPQFFLEKLTPSILSYSESGTRNNNYGSMRLRGISQERINMTLNGIPLNDMIDHGIFFSNFTDFGASINTIQVQRGVGTSSNGASSYAGSINFESVNLQKQEEGAEFQLGAGSFNSYRSSIEYKTGMLENNTAFYGRFSRIWSDGYRYHTGTDSYSFFLSGGWFTENNLLKINAFTGRSRNGLGYGVIPESVLKVDPRTNSLSENDTDDFGQHFIQLQHTYLIGNSSSLVTSAYYGGSGGDFFWGTYADSVFVPELFINDSVTFFQINYPLTNNHYGLLSNYNLSYNDFSIDVGAHAYTFRRNNQEQIVPDYSHPYYDEDSYKNELAVFGKVEYRLGDWTLYGDLQYRTQKLVITPDYEYMDTTAFGNLERTWTFINPKVGFSYLLNDRHTLYASYGRNGREPAKIDIFGGSFQLNRSNLAIAQDENLFQPEYVNDYEGGLKFNYSSTAGQINVFYMQFENEIAPIGEQIAFGVQKRRNIPSSYRTGIEMDLNISGGPFFGGGNATFMKSGISELTIDEQTFSDTKPILSPEWIINAFAGVRPADNLQLQLSGRYVSESFLELTNDPAFMLPAHAILDARIIYDFLDRFTLNVEVNNLFDTNYYSYGAPVDVDFDGIADEPGYYANAGLNFYATLTARF